MDSSHEILRRRRIKYRIGNPRPAFIQVRSQGFRSKKLTVPNEIQSASEANFLPGLENLINKNNSILIRLFWGIVIVSAALICFYQICNRIYIYSTQGTVFKTNIQVNSTVSLPVVTLCLTGQKTSYDWKRQYAQEHNLTDVCQVKWSDLVGYKNKDAKDVWHLYQTKDYINETELQFPEAKLLYPDKAVLKRTSIPTFIGICESIDLSENILQYEYGYITYFRVVIKPPLKDVHCDYDYLKIKIHSPYESVRHDISRESYIINKGIYTDTLLSYRKIVFRQSKEDPCLDHEVFNSCVDDCLDNLMTEGLSCRLPFMNSSLPFCKDSASAMKAYEKARLIYNNPIDCPKCTKRCVEDKYTFLTAPFNTGQKDIVLGVYYKENVFATNTETVAYDFISCLCDIGGNLGLFLGFSLLHIIDIFNTLFFHLISKLIKKK